MQFILQRSSRGIIRSALVVVSVKVGSNKHAHTLSCCAGITSKWPAGEIFNQRLRLRFPKQNPFWGVGHRQILTVRMLPGNRCNLLSSDLRIQQDATKKRYLKELSIGSIRKWRRNSSDSLIKPKFSLHLDAFTVCLLCQIWRISQTNIQDPIFLTTFRSPYTTSFSTSLFWCPVIQFWTLLVMPALGALEWACTSGLDLSQ